ncbi:MAG: hypothetical protein EOP43_06475 [Sphingobacteriaceae bacterium]|nr:MAG: hypothetical protein EOP43_06475 [Sphingobacteriaceae bacterium]
MLESVNFIPRSTRPTLLRIWCKYFVISVISLLISFVTKHPLGSFLFVELLLFLGFLFTKFELKIVINSEKKQFEYYYMNCWGKEKVIVINITTAEGNYKYVKLNKSEFGWQLKFKSDKHNKITVSQGTFQKFQLDQMVRMINQIKKGVFVADVGTEF